jgi:pilus assembly protein CpaB
MAEKRYTLIFYGAVIVAALATFGVYRVLQATKENARVATQPVVVAAQDIPEGATVDRTMLTTVQWPVGTAPAGAFASIDSVAARVTRLSVFKGEAIVPGRLAPTGTGAGIEVKITPGKRAMSIPVSAVSGVSGLIQPNSRVDVLVSIRDEGKEGRSQTANRQVAKLFMDNMRVLGVGQEIQRGPDGKAVQATTVTLEVTPEEAERLAIAVSQGQLSLVLRGYGDPDSVKTRGATSEDVLAQLRGGGAYREREPVAVAQPVARRRVAPAAPRPAVVQQPVVRPPQTEVHRVTVYRAGKATEEKFEKTDSVPGTP